MKLLAAANYSLLCFYSGVLRGGGGAEQAMA